MYNTFSYDMIAHSPQIFLSFLLGNLAVIFFIYWGVEQPVIEVAEAYSCGNTGTA